MSLADIGMLDAVELHADEQIWSGTLDLEPGFETDSSAPWLVFELSGTVSFSTADDVAPGAASQLSVSIDGKTANQILFRLDGDDVVSYNGVGFYMGNKIEQVSGTRTMPFTYANYFQNGSSTPGERTIDLSFIPDIRTPDAAVSISPRSRIFATNIDPISVQIGSLDPALDADSGELTVSYVVSSTNPNVDMITVKLEPVVGVVESISADTSLVGGRAEGQIVAEVLAEADQIEANFVVETDGFNTPVRSIEFERGSDSFLGRALVRVLGLSIFAVGVWYATSYLQSRHRTPAGPRKGSS